MASVHSREPRVSAAHRDSARRWSTRQFVVAATSALAIGVMGSVSTPVVAAEIPGWEDLVLGDGASTLSPVAVTESFGDVTNAEALAGGDGVATLSWGGTGLAPTIIVDFGRNITGLPAFTVADKSAGSIPIRMAYSESLPYLLRKASGELVADAAEGATNVRLSSVDNVVAGQSLVIGTGAQQQTVGVASVGTGAVTNAAFAAIPAGATRAEVLSTTGYVNGGDLYLGTGAERQKVTITSVGRASFATVLAQAAAAGATNIKVQANGQQCYEGFGCFGQAAIAVGDQLEVGGSVVTVTSVGTPGITGTGIGVTALPAAADNAASVVFHGPGISFTPAAASSLPVGSPVTYPGTGVTLAAPLASGYAVGTPITSTPGAVVGDAVQFVGTGVASVRNRNTTVNATGTFATPANQLQGGFRYAAITLAGSGTVAISNVSVAAKFPNNAADEYAGWFNSSDAVLNDIWYAGAYTVDTNMVRAGDQNNSTFGVLIDGAKRDRRIWIGDLYPQALTLFNTFGYGGEGSDFQRNSIRVFGQTPGPGGRINGDSGNWTSATPASGFYSTAYSIYYVVNLGEYYRYTGDIEFVKSQYAAMKNQLNWNATLENGDGLIETTAGNDGRDWNYYDGGKPGAVTSTNVLYYRALSEAAWMAAQLGEALPGDPGAAAWSADAAAWEAKAGQTRQAINDKLFDVDRGVYVMSSQDNGTHSGAAVPQDANALAILFGVAEPEATDGILAFLKENLWSEHGPNPFTADADYTPLVSPFITGYETAARFASGDSEGAFDLIHTVWDRMVDRDNPYYVGTTWENYSTDGTIKDPNASLAHGWSSGPTWQMAAYVLGVTPATPGFKTWTVKPVTGALEWAEGRVPTPSGSFDVSWSREGDDLALRLAAPEGTSGQAWVPVGPGQVANPVSGDVEFVRMDDGYAVFDVRSASAEFAVEKATAFTTEITPRALLGKAYLSVAVTNRTSVPVTLVVSTPYGNKSFPNVAAGKTVSFSANSKLTSIPAGQVQVTATGDGVSESETVSYTAYAVGG